MEQLTPVQQAFETQVKQSPTICKLEEEGIMLLEGQTRIQEHLSEVDERLEDGSRVMKGLIQDVKEVFRFMNTQAQRQEEMHRETKDALKDHKYQDIKEENKKLKQDFEDAKKRRWDILKGLLLLMAGSLVSGISVYIFK